MSRRSKFFFQKSKSDYVPNASALGRALALWPYHERRTAPSRECRGQGALLDHFVISVYTRAMFWRRPTRQSRNDCPACLLPGIPCGTFTHHLGSRRVTTSSTVPLAICMARDASLGSGLSPSRLFACVPSFRIAGFRLALYRRWASRYRSSDTARIPVTNAGRAPVRPWHRRYMPRFRAASLGLAKPKRSVSELHLRGLDTAGTKGQGASSAPPASDCPFLVFKTTERGKT